MRDDTQVMVSGQEQAFVETATDRNGHTVTVISKKAPWVDPGTGRLRGVVGVSIHV